MQYHYVSAELTPELESEVMTLLMGAGIQCASKHDLHTTIVYDPRKGEITEPLAELFPNKIFKAHVVSIDILGDGLVFHLSSTDLHNEFLRLKAAGYQSDFDGYLPHMSLTYDFSEYDVLTLNTLLANWAGRELTFTNEAFGI